MYKIIGADQKEYGPATAEELRQWVAEGRANGQTLVQDEAGPWRPLASYPEFSPAGSAPSPPPPTLPSPGAPPAGLSRPSVSAAPVARTHAFAITGLILGILSVTCGMCCCYGLPFNVLGIIFSAVALSQINHRPEHYTGRGLAVAGLVLSLLSILLVGVLLALGIAVNWQNFAHEFR